MNLLVIGSTGTLGRQLVQHSLRQGYNVRCLLRDPPKQGKFLLDWGAEIAYGDLSLPETLPPVLTAVDIVIDVATARATDDYSVEKIDWLGKIALIEAAKIANIQKFIFFLD